MLFNQLSLIVAHVRYTYMLIKLEPIKLPIMVALCVIPSHAKNIASIINSLFIGLCYHRQSYIIIYTTTVTTHITVIAM